MVGFPVQERGRVGVIAPLGPPRIVEHGIGSWRIPFISGLASFMLLYKPFTRRLIVPSFSPTPHSFSAQSQEGLFANRFLKGWSRARRLGPLQSSRFG